MEVKILERDKHRIKFEIVGDQHTLSNLLSKEFWNEKDTEISGYRVEHPLVTNAVITLETDKKDPVKVMEDTVSRLKKMNKEFISKFKKAAK